MRAACYHGDVGEIDTDVFCVLYRRLYNAFAGGIVSPSVSAASKKKKKTSAMRRVACRQR